jgi:cyclophilin family peptidyl-prolyl cis-trans isomerase
VTLLGLGGCEKKGTPDGPADKPAARPTESAKPEATGTSRLSQPFSEAVLTDQPPDDDEILPDVTLTGKSVGKLFEETRAAWDKVHFVTADGKHWTYVATLETDLGAIDLTMLPEIAPNHVRSFVALARVGYFDGLVFERVIHQKSDADPSSVLDMVEGGCPAGTGDPGYGSIGYWLKAEINEQVKHEEGTVGACLNQSPDSAACRFYVTLSKAPALDGERTVFARVTRGLDVLRRISSQPILNSPEFPDGTRPEHPIKINKVTVQAKEADPATVASKNR